MSVKRIMIEETTPWQKPILAITNSGTETKGFRYIVGAAPTGTFDGFSTHDIVTYNGEEWIQDTPLEGWKTYDLDRDIFLVFDGSEWSGDVNIGEYKFIGNGLELFDGDFTIELFDGDFTIEWDSMFEAPIMGSDEKSTIIKTGAYQITEGSDSEGLFGILNLFGNLDEPEKVGGMGYDPEDNFWGFGAVDLTKGFATRNDTQFSFFGNVNVIGDLEVDNLTIDELTIDESLFFGENIELNYTATTLNLDGSFDANNLRVKEGGKLFYDNFTLAYAVKDSFGFYSSFFFGRGAGNINQTGDSNVAVGADSMSNITTGSWNVAIGAFGLNKVDTGIDNVAISQALINLESGNGNVGIGRATLKDLISGSGNVGIGGGALLKTTLNGNLGIGIDAGFNNEGSNNLFIGNNADVLTDFEDITRSIAIGVGVKVGGSFSSIIGGSGNIIRGDYLEILGGLNNENYGEFSSIFGGSFNIIDTEGEYANIITSSQSYADDYGSFVAGSLGCQAVDSSLIYNSILSTTDGYGALSFASVLGNATGFGAALIETTASTVEGYGNLILQSQYGSVTDCIKSNMFGAIFADITGSYSNIIGGVESEITKDFAYNFGPAIKNMGQNSVGFNLDLLPVEICDDNVMAIMNGKIGVGTCRPETELEIAGNLKTNNGQGTNLKTGIHTYDLSPLAPGLELSTPFFSGETTNTYEAPFIAYGTAFRGTITVIANDRIKTGQLPETVTNEGTGTDWVMLDNVKDKDDNPTSWTSDDIVVDSYDISNTAFPVGADFKKVGQTFKSDEPNILHKIKLPLSNVTTATGNAVVKIYEVERASGLDGIPFGEALATSDPVDVSTIGTTPEEVEFEFTDTNRIRLGPNGHRYALSLEYDGGATFLLWEQDDETLTHHGNGFIEMGSEWQGNPDWNFNFEVEGSPNITIEKIQLVKDGTPVGDNKAQGLSMPLFPESMVWGNEDDLWGDTWTFSDLETLAVDFEVKTSASESKTLRLAFEDFELPPVPIKGLKVEIFGQQLAGNALLFYAVATVYVGITEDPRYIWSAPEFLGGSAEIILNLDTNNLEVTTNFCPDLEHYGEYHSLGQDGLEWENLFLLDGIHTPEDLTIYTGTEKTLVLEEPVYKDIVCPLVVRTTGANRPNLATFVGNILQYQFAVNDIAELEAVELPHDWKEGTEIEIHLHWTTGGANNATPRAVKWEIEYALGEKGGAFTSTTTASAETTIEADEDDRKLKYTQIVKFTPTTATVGSQLVMRLRRITADGTAPVANPFALDVGVHYQVDTLGSRTILHK